MTSLTIKHSVNIDGLPSFKSPSVQFWYILGLIVNITNKQKPFVILLFSGNSKHIPLMDDLQDFNKELETFIENGLVIEHKI